MRSCDCKALGSSSPENPQASVELSMSWSRSRPQVSCRVRDRVSVAQGEFALIREAGRWLRVGVEARREKVQGPVISLHAETAQLFEEFQGRVTLRADVYGQFQRVRVVLSRAEYAHACDARRDGQRVEVTGILQRDARAKLFDLLEPRGFRVQPSATVLP